MENVGPRRVARRLHLALPTDRSNVKRQILPSDDLKLINVDNIFTASTLYLPQKINQISKNHGFKEFFSDMPLADQTALIKDYRKFLRNKGEAFKTFFSMMDKANGNQQHTTMDAWCRAWLGQMIHAHEIIRHAAIFTAFSNKATADLNPHKPGKKSTPHSDGGKPTPKAAATTESPVCNCCGRRGHKANVCVFRLAKHPCTNNEPGVKFSDSTMGKAYQAKFNKSYLNPLKDLTFDNSTQRNTSNYVWPSSDFDGF